MGSRPLGDETVEFPFQAPKDGCYMLEERHPHIPTETAAVPYVVNYCRGRSAPAAVDHTDGRHDQWNYLGHFPYYDDQKNAGVLVPRRLARQEQHAFRYTYVGPKCHAEHAQVHTAGINPSSLHSAAEATAAIEAALQHPELGL